jgi:hypothetical protein
MTSSAHGVDFDTTIAALQQEPAAIAPNDAIAIIDSWQQQLQGHDIAADLGELKQALQQGNNAEISKILADLGEDTTEVAADLPADISAKVKQIGQLLSQAAKVQK